MKNFYTYTFKHHKLRVMTVNNKAWFVAKDIRKILGYPYHEDPVKRYVAVGDFGTMRMKKRIFSRDVLCVNSAGIETLAFCSKKSNNYCQELERLVSEIRVSITSPFC